jgi:hypothetical protein
VWQSIHRPARSQRGSPDPSPPSGS